MRTKSLAVTDACPELGGPRTPPFPHTRPVTPTIAIEYHPHHRILCWLCNAVQHSDRYIRVHNFTSYAFRRIFQKHIILDTLQNAICEIKSRTMPKQLI